MRATRLRSIPLQVLSVVALVWAGLCAQVHARDRLFREAYAHANTQQGGKLLCEAMPEIGDYIVGVYRNHPVASVVNSLESLPMNLQQFDSFNLFSATLTRADVMQLLEQEAVEFVECDSVVSVGPGPGPATVSPYSVSLG